MPRAPRTRGRILLATILAAGGLALLAGALVAARNDASRLPAGVTVGGLDVGGLDEGVARAALQRHARRLAGGVVSVTTPDRPDFAVRVSATLLRPRARIDEALVAARAADGLGARLLGAVGLGDAPEVPLRFDLSDAGVEQLVERVQGRLGRRPRPATVRVTDTGLEVVPGRAGRGVDEAALLDRLETLPSRISLPVTDQPSQVSLEEAERARLQARAVLDAPPVVRGPGGALTLTAGDLRGALRFRPRAPRLLVSLDPEAIGARLREAFPGVERPVRDARLVPRGTLVDIVPERAGRTIDAEGMAEALLAAPAGRVRLLVRPVRPERTAADLRALGITEQVAEYSTPYACCQPRVTNIQRAAELLDGTLIPAGGRFSLNEALGERTVERGFVAAPQIAGGRFEDAVGGGVSQVATTLFNAAFFAGLQIVTHTPHEFWLSRYPKGREATVSWGGPELVLRNDWPAAVYLGVTATSDAVTVRVYSNPLDRRVETTTGEPTDPVPPEVKREEDPELAPGEEVVDMPMGGPGFTIAYTRRVYRGETLKRDERWTWTYRPENALVRVGPGTVTSTAPDVDGGTAPDAPEAPAAPREPDGTGTGSAQPPPPG